MQNNIYDSEGCKDHLPRLIALGIALSAERDHGRLLERILLETQIMTNADAATLYLCTEDDSLAIKINRNYTLNIFTGGTTGTEVTSPPIMLHHPETGAPNDKNVAAHAVLSAEKVFIADAYDTDDFDFSDTKEFDRETGYHSKSFLTVPLKNYNGKVVGVLQLINARDTDGTVIAFPADIFPLVDALASHAAVAILPRLIELGIALSAEHSHGRLLERILLEAKDMANADGGTLYLCTEDDCLAFKIVRNDTLKIAMGGTTGNEVLIPPLRLHHLETGAPNHNNVATHTALSGEKVIIDDVYEAKDFDFSGAKIFDTKNNYRSQSFLTVPLKNYNGEVVGVLQLINARGDKGKVIPFPPEILPLIDALASQAAVAISNQELIEAQRKLLESFIHVIAHAIDAKSPYTGGHCERVPDITKLLAEAAHEASSGPFEHFRLNEDLRYELYMASWLHDCGKVATPEYVVDKATKLEIITDRLHEIRARFEILRRDAEIDFLKKRLDGGDEAELKQSFDARCQELQDQFAFIAETNLGGEFMKPERVERLKQIGAQTWTRYFDRTVGLSWVETDRLGKDVPPPPVTEFLLADRPDHKNEHYNLGEIYNLSIARGTLTEEERSKINGHVNLTIEMLNQMPFPKNLRHVCEFAGAHHEKMDGTGYPHGLKRDEMSIPARIMAIADIFEALTAADRPYKPTKTLSEVIKIMSFMKKDQHIDGDLFDLFLVSGVYKEYAKTHLKPNQIDEVDITPYLSKRPTE